MVKCFYILICITIFKLCSCDRREALGNESILGKKFLVYFVKSPFSKANDDSWRCSGAIISPTQILTAASCLVEMERIYAIAGYKKYIRDHDIHQDTCTNMTKQKVIKIIVPKEYQLSSEKPKTSMNLDIGVAIVEKPYSFPDQKYRVHCSYEPQIVGINFDETNEMEKTQVVEIKWGGQVTGNLSTSSPQDMKSQPLREVPATIIQKKNCADRASNEELQKLLDKYFLCVSDNSFVEDDDFEFKLDDHFERCTNRRRSDPTRDDSCFEDDSDFRRRNTNVNDTEQHDSNIKITNSNSERCHYEHGGPLVRRIGEEELVIGVALNSISNQNSNQCNPHLYISTAKAANIIKCLLETNATERKLCNDLIDKRFEVNEIEIKWSSNTYSSKETSQNIPAYLRQGNEEEPLVMRPTKVLGKLKDVQGKPAQFGEPESATYEPGVDQKRKKSNSYYQPQEQLQDQMQFNNQYKDQSQGQQQQQPYYPYDQPREESNVHHSYNQDSYRQPVNPYNQPQIDSYNQPQIDPYDQPQIDSYNQPPIDLYNQPQIDSYNQPKKDPNNQPHIDSYNKPQKYPYNQPQVDSYNEPQKDPYDQPQIDPYNQPQIDSYDQPQRDPYNQPQKYPYNQPQVDSYNEPRKDPYNQPQKDSYNQPQIDSYDQPQIDVYNQPQIESYNQPQTDSYNQPQVNPYNQPQADPYRPQQVETYNQPQVPSYFQPEVKSYNQQSYNRPQVESYKPPQIESYKQTQGESYNEKQIDSFKLPEMESYEPPQSQSQLNQPQRDPYNKSEIRSLQSHIPQLESYQQPQLPPYKTPEKMKAPSIESYNPVEILSGNQQVDTFKIVKPPKPSPMELYRQLFKPTPVEILRQSLTQNFGQTAELAHNPSPAQQIDFMQNTLREKQPDPTSDSPTPEPQIFEQLYSQINSPVISPPAIPVSEQTFEEVYKNLHDPSFEIPHGPEIEEPRGQAVEYLNKQPIAQMPKLSEEPENIETQLSEKNQDEVKVRPQVPLDYQDYTSYNRKSETIQ